MKVIVENTITNKQKIETLMNSKKVQNFFKDVMDSFEFTEDRRNSIMCGGLKSINISSRFNLEKGIDVILDPQTEIVWVE